MNNLKNFKHKFLLVIFNQIFYLITQEAHTDADKSIYLNEDESQKYCHLDSLKNGLVSTTEKALKDAVSSLRNDMMDITSRINEIEERLNQMTQIQFQQKVLMNSNLFTIFISERGLNILPIPTTDFFLIFKYSSIEKCCDFQSWSAATGD